MRLRTIYSHRHDPEYSRVYADIYWRSLLIIICLVFVAASIYGATTFFGVVSVLDSVAPQGATNKGEGAFNTSMLEATLNGYATRQAEFQILEKSAVPALPDPSK